MSLLIKTLEETSVELVDKADEIEASEGLTLLLGGTTPPHALNKKVKIIMRRGLNNVNIKTPLMSD